MYKYKHTVEHTSHNTRDERKFTGMQKHVKTELNTHKQSLLYAHTCPWIKLLVNILWNDPNNGHEAPKHNADFYLDVYVL